MGCTDALQLVVLEWTPLALTSLKLVSCVLVNNPVITNFTVGPTLPADGNSEVVAGSTLTLTVTITDLN